MDEEETEEFRFASLECKICVRGYSADVADRLPVILPSCGHTVCWNCAHRCRSQKTRNEIVCPFDRMVSKMKNSTDFKRNFSVMETLREVAAKQAIAEKKIIQPPKPPEVQERPPPLPAKRPRDLWKAYMSLFETGQERSIWSLQAASSSTTR